MTWLFYLISAFIFIVVTGVAHFWPPVLWSLLILVPLFLIGLEDALQKRRAVKRNFPLVGKLRYFFEMIRPELQQYFVESNHSGRPIPREWRSVVYQRAKGEMQTLPFGTQRDVYEENHEWVNHSMMPVDTKSVNIRVQVGGPQCTKPYSASVFNVSGMSYGALSQPAIEALNLGAKMGGFYHNTGEGGLSPYHQLGGDLVWQIGTGYFGCRNSEGRFCSDSFKERATLEEVKMIEIKVSQGAKPGKGGILPAAKVTEEVAKIRGVEQGKDVISPNYHTAFHTPEEMLHFIQKLRDLSGGKPVGFKICVGKKSEVFAICKAIVKLKIYPDFITVDGSEGGTGAAPLEFSNSVGTPLVDGLAFVTDCLIGFGVRDKITVIASGKVFTSFQMLTKMALGADIINSSRAMMLALGCIQALKCNSNHCPVGVATTDKHLTRGLVVSDKKQRVARYHEQTIKALADMLAAMGYSAPRQIRRKDIYRRLSDGAVQTYNDLFPCVSEKAYLDESNLPEMCNELLVALKSSHSTTFSELS